jgi:HK97 gp10 family phage protein
MSVEFKDHSGEVKAQMDKNIGKALEAIGLKWQEIVTREMTEVKWKNKKGDLVDIIDTGRLRGSMDYKVDPANQRVVVGTNVEYGFRVHFGTSRMPARPYIDESVQNYKEDYQEIATKVLGEGFEVTTTKAQVNK